MLWETGRGGGNDDYEEEVDKMLKTMVEKVKLSLQRILEKSGST